ncbi:uncharacterized protein RJT21DRAFT_113358 [Scheffersomyces amazonensis]|uniref:uncharacterized protein n=1 Tax=Scheffersomyces amazonensis TaxID=1078765 RepID=UPI00315D96A9
MTLDSTNSHSFYINNYIKFAWIIISSKNSNLATIQKFQEFNRKYGNFIRKLIENSQLTRSNLIISLYYLYKYYNYNGILNHNSQPFKDSDSEELNVSIDYSLIINLIIVSLILSNKCFDDQSYTLKTWLIIINNTMGKSTLDNNHNKKIIKIDLKLINSLESYFLCSVNYSLSFIKLSKDYNFWNILSSSHVFKLSTSIISKFKALVELTVHEPASAIIAKSQSLLHEQPILLTPGSEIHKSPLSATPLATPISKKSTATMGQLPLPLPIVTVSPLSSTCCTPLTPLTPYSDVKRRKLPLHQQLYTYSFKHHYKAPIQPLFHQFTMLPQIQPQGPPMLASSVPQFQNESQQHPQQQFQLPIHRPQLPSQSLGQQASFMQQIYSLPSQPSLNQFEW